MKERKAPQIEKTFLRRIGEVVDRVVLAVSPEAGVRRMAIRSAHDRHSVRMAAIEGAEATNTRGSAWISSRLSPDSALESDLETLKRNSRELYLNDSIGGAVDSRTNLVVSYGFVPQAKIAEKKGLATKEQAEQWNQELEDVYERLSTRITKTGKGTLWQDLRLVERCHGYDGESLTILSDRGGTDKPVPLTIEVVDTERLQTPPHLIGNPRVRMGVEYDSTGMIVAYHIRDTHPGDTSEVNDNFTRYPADRILHVFERWFAGQTRAFPWLTRSLSACKDTKDLGEAAIIAAQVEACYAAFVTSSGASGYNGATGAATEIVGGKRMEDIRPGTIRYLDIGEQVHFGTPTRSAGYAPIQEWNYRRAAAGMNFPYEMIAKNWSGLSFAGGRLSLADAKLFVKAQQKLLRESWLAQIWNRMVEEAVIVGAVSIPARLYVKAPWHYQKHEWGDPAWPYALTPGEEIDAAADAVNNNFRTKASVVAEFGGNLEDVFKERERERRMEREMEIEPATADEVPVAPKVRPQEQPVGAGA